MLGFFSPFTVLRPAILFFKGSALKSDPSRISSELPTDLATWDADMQTWLPGMMWSHTSSPQGFPLSQYCSVLQSRIFCKVKPKIKKKLKNNGNENKEHNSSISK